MPSGLLRNQYFDIDRFVRLLKAVGAGRRNEITVLLFALACFWGLAFHHPEAFGIDARIYHRAAVAYAHGANPWDAVVLNPAGNPLHFGALPTTVQVLQPFTWMPERAFVWVAIAACVASAGWTVWKLRLPSWWMIFPPLSQGIFVANPQVVLLGLLLVSYPAVAAIAPLLKIYAIAPLVGELRVRALVFFALFLAISLALGPDMWRMYASDATGIADRLLHESRGGYSATGNSLPLTLVTIVGVVLLARVDLPAAGWLVAPALVPASQFHLSTMALPVLARGVPFWFLILMSLPIHGMPSAAIAIYGAWRAYATVRDRRKPRSTVDHGEADS
jgi:hypothetical protein